MQTSCQTPDCSVASDGPCMKSLVETYSTGCCNPGPGWCPVSHGCLWKNQRVKLSHLLVLVQLALGKIFLQGLPGLTAELCSGWGAP